MIRFLRNSDRNKITLAVSFKLNGSVSNRLIDKNIDMKAMRKFYVSFSVYVLSYNQRYSRRLAIGMICYDCNSFQIHLIKEH